MPYRPITESEIPVVADIQARSFRSERSRYIETYSEGSRMGWRELRLLDDEQGAPVAALALFFRPMSLNGGELEAGLVGGVGVPPESRRRGYGRRLIQGMLEELHARQTPVSLLFPFSVAWYRSLGYGMANLSWRIEQPLRLLPDFPERLHVRRATEEDEAAIRACHQSVRLELASNGWLARTEAEWKWAFRPENERALFAVEGDGVEGYLLYHLNWDALEVVEWVAASERAWRGLLAFISAQGEQAKQLIANLPQGSPLLWTLREPYDRVGAPIEFVFRRAAELVSGFMLRVVHLPEALAQRRYPVGVSAEFRLEIDDPQLPANCAPLAVAIRAGQADLAPASTSSDTIRTDIAAFSELYAGVLTAEQARAAGRLTGSDEACRALSAAFAAAPLHMWSADWF